MILVDIKENVDKLDILNEQKEHTNAKKGMNTKAVNIGEKRSRVTTNNLEKEILGTSEKSSPLSLRRSQRNKDNNFKKVADAWHFEKESDHSIVKEYEHELKRAKKATKK